MTLSEDRLPPAVTVLVPVFGGVEMALRCIRSFDERTPPDVRLLVVDDCGDQRLTADEVASAVVSGRDTEFVMNPHNLGFVGTVNKVFDLRRGDDIVLVNSDVVVLPGWFEPLQTAAYSAPSVASATTLADHGGIVSAPGLALLGEEPAERLAARQEAVESDFGGAPWVRLPAAVGHCCYLRADALSRVGPLDLAFSPGYGEEVDWSFRAHRAGLTHHAALTSWVLHDDAGSFGARRGKLQRSHEWLLLRRYPLQFVRARLAARGFGSVLGQAMRRVESRLALH